MSGKIIDFLEKKGFKIIAQKTKLTRIQAEEFYNVHKERPFSKN